MNCTFFDVLWQCRKALPRFLVVFVGLSASHAALAVCDRPVAHLISLQGRVEYSAAGETEWHPAVVGQGLCAGELVTVRRQGRATVQFEGDVLTRLDQFTTLEIAATPKDGDVALGLSEGIVHVISRLKRRVEIIAPVVNALVEGTEFTVMASAGKGQVVVAEGHVRVSNPKGALRLAAGQAAAVAGDNAPTSIQVRPLDAVHWAIYYPIVFSPDGASYREPNRLAALGDFNAALAALDASAGDDARVLRANLLLGVGRADDAAALLESSTAQGADAAAVRAVMLVAQGQFASAREVIDGVSVPTPAAHLANSYVCQAEGRLDDALTAVNQAIEAAPDNALAWARKAELELTLADARNGERSAAKALALQPGTVHAEALKGFALMLQATYADARDTLARAIEHSPSDPLAHFALGLSMIRQDAADDGRRELEIAVLLDPSNVEYRSTLGRAYMAANDDYRASNQLDLAQRIDPASPTPRFLNAQRKLTQGDVLGAIEDGDAALAANDSRLSLRTPAMLDSDRSARGSTLGAAYLMAGFDATLASIAAGAVEVDPLNASSHRLMANALTNDRRLERARVSAQLQGFALGRVGDPMISAESLVTSLPAMQGARISALHDTTALLDGSPDGVSVSALAGSQETYSTSLNASMSTDRFQVGMGYYDYNSDGFTADGKVDLEAHRGQLRWQGNERSDPVRRHSA